MKCKKWKRCSLKINNFEGFLNAPKHTRYRSTGMHTPFFCSTMVFSGTLWIDLDHISPWHFWTSHSPQKESLYTPVASRRAFLADFGLSAKNIQKNIQKNTEFLVFPTESHEFIAFQLLLLHFRTFLLISELYLYFRNTKYYIVCYFLQLYFMREFWNSPIIYIIFVRRFLKRRNSAQFLIGQN